MKILFLILTSLMGLAQASAQSQPTANANIEIVQKYFTSLQTGNMKQLSEILADDIVWHQPGASSLSGVYNGKEQVFALFGKFMEISQGTFKIDSVGQLLSNSDLVTATLHFSASNAQGSISMSGVDLMRIKNNKIAEVWLFSENQNAEDKFWK